MSETENIKYYTITQYTDIPTPIRILKHSWIFEYLVTFSRRAGFEVGLFTWISIIMLKNQTTLKNSTFANSLRNGFRKKRFIDLENHHRTNAFCNVFRVKSAKLLNKLFAASMSYLHKHYLGLASSRPFTVLYDYAHTHALSFIVHTISLNVAHTYVVIAKACI